LGMLEYGEANLKTTPSCIPKLPRNIEFRFEFCFEFCFPEGELETELETELALLS
jgi:hypothetical protein